MFHARLQVVFSHGMCRLAAKYIYMLHLFLVLNTVIPLLFFMALMLFKELLQLRALRDLSVLIPVSSVGSGLFYSRALHFGGSRERPGNVRRKERLLLGVCTKLVRKIS